MGSPVSTYEDIGWMKARRRKMKWVPLLKGRQYTWRTGTQDSPPGTGGDDERQRVGVVDQIQLRIFIRDLIYHPGLRPPLLFQEGSLASPSVKYIDAS